MHIAGAGGLAAGMLEQLEITRSEHTIRTKGIIKGLSLVARMDAQACLPICNLDQAACKDDSSERTIGNVVNRQVHQIYQPTPEKISLG